MLRKREVGSRMLPAVDIQYPHAQTREACLPTGRHPAPVQKKLNVYAIVTQKQFVHPCVTASLSPPR